MTLTVSDLDEAVEAAKSGRRTVLSCPSHEDSHPSLSVGPGTDHPVVLKCMAGCETEDILGAAGLDWSDISAEREEVWTPRGVTVSSKIYPYYDEQGTLLYEVLRVDRPGGKDIVQRRPDPTATHGYAWNLDGVDRSIFNLPQVLEAVRGGYRIHVAEGEKCALALQNVLPPGEVATTNSGGAGRWQDKFSKWLAGSVVYVYADADDPGRNHAREVRESLLRHGCNVRVLEPPPGVDGAGEPIQDVADHLSAGLGFSDLLETTPESQTEKARTGIDIIDAVKRDYSQPEWVIKGVLQRNERLLLTGVEGSGKSTVMRQIATCAAAGLNPWTGQPNGDPKRVLFIDAQDHPSQTIAMWSDLIGLCARLDHPVQRGMLTLLEEWDRPPHLDAPEGAAWLRERCYAYRPDLIVMGPVLNLMSGDATSHEVVKTFRLAIDEARLISNSAVLMEHHSPHRMAGDKIRELRPYGSGEFLRWPDYGKAIVPTDTKGLFEMRPFRGDRVWGRHFPDALRVTDRSMDSLSFPFREDVIE